MHHPGTGQVAGRGLVSYADGDQASAFAQMLGGLIDANVQSRPEKRADFDALSARVGIAVTDIDESVTLDFKGGRLVVSNGLKPDRDITIRGDADTIMELSNMRIGFAGMPNYVEATGRSIVGKMIGRRLKIEGILGNVTTLNRVTRVFSVQ